MNAISRGVVSLGILTVALFVAKVLGVPVPLWAVLAPALLAVVVVGLMIAVVALMWKSGT